MKNDQNYTQRFVRRDPYPHELFHEDPDGSKRDRLVGLVVLVGGLLVILLNCAGLL